jgi:hypothetical protein
VFVGFDQFPWFKNATIGKLLNVKLPHPGHLYWPDLDIDLAIESIEQPDRYPLVSRPGVSKVRESKRGRPAPAKKSKAGRRRVSR